MTPQLVPTPVTYPALAINGVTYQFRFTQSSRFLLESWGYDLSPDKKLPALAWAAAMAGFVDPSGSYRSAGFKTPTEFTDQLGLEDDLNLLYQAVTEALKKVAPKATIALDTPTANASDNTGAKPS